jgi:hypothetical protein
LAIIVIVNLGGEEKILDFNSYDEYEANYHGR